MRNEMSLQVATWSALLLILSVCTFGLGTLILLVICILVCLIGMCLLLYLRHKYTAEEFQNLLHSARLSLPDVKVSQNLQMDPSGRHYRHDRRLTGSTIIDDPLQEVLHYAFRDYIQTWFSHISADDEFLQNIKEMVQKVIITFASRSKEVEWVPYLTTRLVDDFASHLRLFRQAQAKLKAVKEKDPSTCSDLLSLFFDMETSMEDNMCRDLVCTSESHEKEYLQELCESILYLLLPPDDFQNKMARFLIREVAVNAAVLPVISLFSDPDYINQTIVWLCRDTLMSSEGFLLVLRCTDNEDELQAVREIVNHEMAVQRSRDTGGDDDAEIKQQLSSLSYVRKVVDIRLRRLQEGTVDTDSTGIPTDIDWKRLAEPGVKLFSLPFDVILTNNIALHYFTDFMTSIGAQGYVFFYHSVEGFKVSTEQMLSQAELVQITHSTSTQPDLETLREAAVHIYELYLSDKASLRVKLEDGIMKKLISRIRTEKPSCAWFEEAQMKVFDIMQEEPYFPTFRKSQSYIKLLAELDLLKDVNIKSDDDGILLGSKLMSKCAVDEISLNQFDTLSLSSLDQDDDGMDYLGSDTASYQGRASPSGLSDDWSVDETMTLSAHIYNTGIANYSGQSYAVYAIAITRKEANSPEERWCVLRRYSDFRDFHLSVVDKFPSLSTFNFPGKKAFNNLSLQFLEKRTQQLNEYLQCLLNTEVLTSCPGLRVMALHFFEPKIYEKGRRPLSKTMGTLVSPLKSSVKTMGNMVKTMPDAIIDGLKDGLVRVLGGRVNPSFTSNLPGSSKVAAGLDIEGEDNIPLRIMLLLMDEVFDLKSKDQWFRRRIVILLRQIIKATFGDTINRKILDYVSWITSPEQVAEYIKAFKQAFWPNGSLALPSSDRDYHTVMRTRAAAKLVMLCSVPDELKHVIGSETTRKGVLCVFEMFQHAELNRRLVYVLLEGILELLFPNNNLPQIFRQLHSQSPRTSVASANSNWPKEILRNIQKFEQKR